MREIIAAVGLAIAVSMLLAVGYLVVQRVVGSIHLSGRYNATFTQAWSSISRSLSLTGVVVSALVGGMAIAFTLRFLGFYTAERSGWEG